MCMRHVRRADVLLFSLTRVSLFRSVLSVNSVLSIFPPMRGDQIEDIPCEKKIQPWDPFFPIIAASSHFLNTMR